MATIQQQIDVAADPAFVRSTWDRFIQWARTGPGRLACSELACVDAVRAGLVEFVPARPGGTTVIFRLDAGSGGVSGEELERQLGHDLVTFKDYVERSGLVERDWLPGQAPAATERVAVEVESGRRGDKPRHTRLSGEGETTFWHSHFPT